ncbi:MAG TPA: hypothetical protein PLN61_08840 [bacterium]|nr:hypothetical protein [bacterium]HQI48761.1 hypothetical protein [bacterium]HQJ66490.1 hypothetical protein [bacterium]
MKIPEMLKFLPKTLGGILVVLIGAGLQYIPVIGQVAGEAVISAGVMAILYGLTDKVIRYRHGGDVFQNEKYVAQKVRATWTK